MEKLLIEWANNAVKDAPVLVALAIGAWDLRARLLDCMSKNSEMLDKLLAEILRRE